MLGSVWGLLITVSFVTPVVSTVHFGWKYGSFSGALIGFCIVLAFGAGNFFGLDALARGVWRWLRSCEEKEESSRYPEFALKLLYITALLWIIVSGWLGMFVMKAVVHWYR
jgi:hypothetical protein